MVLWPASIYKVKNKLKQNKTIYDYKNADIDGLTQYIKAFDSANAVFNQPIINQAEIYSNILKQAFTI